MEQEDLQKTLGPQLDTKKRGGKKKREIYNHGLKQYTWQASSNLADVFINKNVNGSLE